MIAASMCVALAGYFWPPALPEPERVTLLDVAATADLLAVALQGSIAPVQAIEQVAEVSPHLVKKVLRQVAAAYKWGLSSQQAWARQDPAWQRLGSALGVAIAAGAAPGVVLHAAADSLRAQARAAAENRGSTLGVKITLPLGLAFLPAFFFLAVLPLIVSLIGNTL